MVVRAFGWSMLLGADGLDQPGACASSASAPCKLLYTEIAIVIALVHVMLPFMVIPVWTSLQKLDPQVENAALSLRASPLHGAAAHRAAAGRCRACLSGSLIVFGLSASAFAIPGLLGGRRLKVVGDRSSTTNTCTS